MHPRFQTAFAQLADNLDLHWETYSGRQVLPRFVDRGASSSSLKSEWGWT